MNHNHHITLENSNIIVKYTNEWIIPANGLAVVGALLGKSNFTKKLNHMDVTKNRSQHQIKNGDISWCASWRHGTRGHWCYAYGQFKDFKAGGSRTYKGFDGYAPMMAYIGTEGYAVNFELREGKQHFQNGTVEILLETINLCKQYW